MTPVAFDISEAKKRQYGEIYEDVSIDVEIERRVGGCTELSSHGWTGTLCEKCLGELVKNKIINEK